MRFLKMKTGVRSSHFFPPLLLTSLKLVCKSSSERKMCWTPQVRDISQSENIHCSCKVLSSRELQGISRLTHLGRTLLGYDTDVKIDKCIWQDFTFLGAEAHRWNWEKFQGEVDDTVQGGVNITKLDHTGFNIACNRKVRALLSTDAGAMGVDVKSTRLVVICSATSTSSGFQQEVQCYFRQNLKSLLKWP